MYYIMHYSSRSPSLPFLFLPRPSFEGKTEKKGYGNNRGVFLRRTHQKEKENFKKRGTYICATFFINFLDRKPFLLHHNAAEDETKTEGDTKIYRVAPSL